MFRSLLIRRSRSRGRTGLQYLLAASSLDDSKDWPSSSGGCLFVQRSLGQKGPGKRSKYALRRKEEIENYKKSPFGVDGRPGKHFDELKFYHPRNKHGQKETLIDGLSKDLAFFNPVTGDFDRDPRKAYQDSGSDDNVNDEEAALYADFTDTDDEDVYFGGGKDADGDYDDEGNELRPKSQRKKKSWADADSPVMSKEEDTDPDEDEREFNEVFGRDFRSNGRGFRGGRGGRGRGPPMGPPMGRRGGRHPGGDWRGRGDDMYHSNFGRGFNPRFGGPGGRHSRRPQELDFSRPDPELGIDETEFTQKFENKKRKKKVEDVKTVAEKGFSADEFLKDEISSDEELDSDIDEEKMIERGDEELEELTDVSDMIRDYDRPDENTPAIPVTEELVKEETEREMKAGEFYESDDVEFPHTDDPKMKREIAEEHEMNLKRLKSTPGGRKTLKTISKDSEWKENFPECDRRLYENALRDTPHDGPPPAGRKSPPKPRGRKEPKIDKSPEKQKKVHYVSKDDPRASFAPSKAKDSWRTLSAEFDADAAEPDFLADLKEEEEERREQRAQRDEEDRLYHLRGRPPYGGPGVRYYSTSAHPGSRRQASPTVEWQEAADQRTHAARFAKVGRMHRRRDLSRATHLHRYWSRFPSDARIQRKAQLMQNQLRHHGTLYVAMTLARKLIFGVAAPKESIAGEHNVANQFSPAQGCSTPTIVKVDLHRFRRLKQRGEILTGGPHFHGAVEETACDWTGHKW